MDQLPVRPEAGSGPAVLVVHAALARIETPCRRTERPLAQRMHEPDERARALDRSCLVGRSNLERSKARMKPDVPPEACVILREAGRRDPLDKRLPLRVVAERGRCAVTRKESQPLSPA